jgi:D-glycero-beta-D-manno-heptose-7-phosphate kinase
MSRFVIHRDRFSEIVGKISSKKILIVGDVGVDRYTFGSAHRLSPEAPVPIVAVSSQKDKLGLAANVADNIREFGATPILASVVGEDRNCEELFQLLKKTGISTQYLIRHSSRRTTMKERVVAQDQQVVRIDHETTAPLSSEAEELYLKSLLPMIGSFDAIILEDYGKGLLTDFVAKSVIEEAKKQNVFMTVDPTTAVRSPHVYRGVSLFKPNAHEAERLSRVQITDESSLNEAASILMKEVDSPIVIITQGKAGMTLFTRKDPPMHIPTFARTVHDVSGAGDTVISMLTLAMVCGASLVEAALLANFAAGVEVGKRGTATVSLQELEQYMQMVGGLS